MKKKFFALMSVLLFMLLPISVSADIGPKSSVRIVIEGLGDEVCYGTLLSQTDYTVGASVWDGREETARHSGNYEYCDVPEEIWRAFVEYKDTDGFYYLQRTWNFGEAGTIDWTIPPDTFKVLLYFPESEIFAVSEICERYAFHSYYTVDVSSFTDNKLTVTKTYDYKWDTVSFFARFCITVVLEVLIAFGFGFRSKRELQVLCTANFATQLFLNAALFVIGTNVGSFGLIGSYILLEFLVTAIELLLYYFALCRKKGTSFEIVLAYTAIANFISFVAGVLIALIIPVLF